APADRRADLRGAAQSKDHGYRLLPHGVLPAIGRFGRRGCLTLDLGPPAAVRPSELLLRIDRYSWSPVAIQPDLGAPGIHRDEPLEHRRDDDHFPGRPARDSARPL